MSLARLHFDPREHGWRDRLYRICGMCKNYPPEQALLDVGFMTIFRRTDCFILIWACIAVLADHRQLSFSKLSRLQNETHKNTNVVLFAAMLFSKRCLLSCMVGLIQLPNSTRVICFQGHGPCGCQGRRGARVSARFIASKV